MKKGGAALVKRKINRRIYIFDNLKFILMALVVVGHFADAGIAVSETYRSLFVFIYSFHMPLTTTRWMFLSSAQKKLSL